MKRNLKIILILCLILTLSSCQRKDSQPDKQTNNDTKTGSPSVSISYPIKIETLNLNLMMDRKLEPIYDKYKATLDDEVLRGLAPIDILRIHNKAVEEWNVQVYVSLINLPAEVKKKDFEKEVMNDKISKKNEKILIEKYKKFTGKVTETTVSETEAYVEIENDGFWRFEKTKSGIWKLGWLARQ